jgi:hypothetical protein
MFKRFLMAALCVSALGVATLATPDTAEARRYWRRPYVSYYYGPPVYYGWSRPYRYYRPRYYAPYRYRYYGYPDYYYYGPRGGIAFRFGW